MGRFARPSLRFQLIPSACKASGPAGTTAREFVFFASRRSFDEDDWNGMRRNQVLLQFEAIHTGIETSRIAQELSRQYYLPLLVRAADQGLARNSPSVAALRLLNWIVIGAHVPAAHEPVFIELPMLIAASAVPLAV